MIVRERILQASVEAFERGGLDGLSMRKIAAAVGLTPMALYRHFADKQALVDAITLHGLEVWTARLAQVHADNPIAWLQAMSEAFLDYALEAPRLYEAAFRLRARSARRFPDDFVAGRSPPIKMVFEHIEAARRDGLIGEAPTAEIALTLWALGQGLIDLFQAGRFAGGEAEFRAVHRQALRRCIASFGPERPLP
jgi:AcrR family transcriptional regulator